MRQNAKTQKPKILVSFYQTILEEGFEGASIAKVAARIDMKPTLILHYFGNKEILTISLVDYIIESYGQLMKKFRSSSDDPEERLVALLNVLWSKQYYEKIHIAVSFSVISISFRNKRVKKKLIGLYDVFKRKLVKDLQKLKDEGAVKASDIEKTVDVLISMVEGSRHFRHFHVKNKDIKEYNKNMVKAAFTLLKTP